MACATLKRSLDFDPLHTSPRSPKRRRCIPMTQSPLTPPTKIHQVNPSPFGNVSPKVKSAHIAASLAAEIKRMQRRKQLHFPSHSAAHSSQESQSVDHSSDSDSTTSESGDTAMMVTGHSSPGPTNSASSSSFFNALSPSKREAPLFTFKQVSMFCERMLKEREDQIKSDYDKVLTCKLAEQYEAFLKFNHDQLQRRFSDSAPSYVS